MSTHKGMKQEKDMEKPYNESSFFGKNEQQESSDSYINDESTKIIKEIISLVSSNNESKEFIDSQKKIIETMKDTKTVQIRTMFTELYDAIIKEAADMPSVKTIGDRPLTEAALDLQKMEQKY